jgi:hypothetical protein
MERLKALRANKHFYPQALIDALAANPAATGPLASTGDAGLVLSHCSACGLPLVVSHPLFGRHQGQHPNLPFRLTTHPRHPSTAT